MASDLDLFHYTDAKGLKGIIDCQNIWATHYRFLNDTSECAYLGSLVRDKLVMKVEEFWERHNLFGNPEIEVDVIWECMTKSLSDLSPPFISSFCKHRQEDRKDGLLSQWRAYSRSSGYCICLERSELGSRVVQDTIHSEIIDVQYKQPGEAEFDQNEIAAVLADAENLMIYQQLPSERAKRKVRQNPQFEKSLMFIVKNMARFKHPSFNEENEVRVVVFNHFSSVAKANPQKILYRTAGETFIPYINVFANDHLPIKQILVGPGPEQERRAEGLRSYLKNHCRPHVREIEVLSSGIPYSSL